MTLDCKRVARRFGLVVALALAFGANAEEVETEQPSIVLTAAEHADFVKVVAFLTDSLRASDERLRGIAGTTQTFFDDDALPKARRVSVDTLAEQARGSTDPIVLSLLIQQCQNDRLVPRPTCDAKALATRWTVADTQNQVAWLTLASVLRHAGEDAASRAAFERGARASLWHESYDDGSRIVAAAMPKGLGPRARLAVLEQALSSSAAWLTPIAAVQELSFRCTDPALRAACRQVLDTIERDGGSLLSLRVAANIGGRSGLDAETMARRTHTVDAMTYASIDTRWKSYREITDPDELEAEARAMERRVALGEVAWMKGRLAALGPEQQPAIADYIRERDGARARAADDEKKRMAGR